MADIDESLECIKGIHGEVKLYKDDPALPVYRWGLEKGMYTDDVAEIIIKGRIDRSQIATRGPTSVENNTVFVVDTSFRYQKAILLKFKLEVSSENHNDR